jgi:hypothetical protein
VGNNGDGSLNGRFLDAGSGGTRWKGMNRPEIVLDEDERKVEARGQKLEMHL